MRVKANRIDRLQEESQAREIRVVESIRCGKTKRYKPQRTRSVTKDFFCERLRVTLCPSIQVRHPRFVPFAWKPAPVSMTPILLRRRRHLYIAFACFSARSPMTGSLYIWPWFAFMRSTIQRMKPPRLTRRCKGNVIRARIGTIVKIESPRCRTNSAPAKNRHCHEWKRMKRFLL